LAKESTADSAKLGFEGTYFVLRDGRSQHGCFVFGSRTKYCKTSDAMEDDEEFQFDDDMTASIVLKQDTKMCVMLDNYVPPSRGKDEPQEWKVLRGLLGQAMIFSWDVLHCLARRGVRVDSVPVVVVAGKTDLSDTNHLCLLDA
jgi:hypothetical protein